MWVPLKLKYDLKDHIISNDTASRHVILHAILQGIITIFPEITLDDALVPASAMATFALAELKQTNEGSTKFIMSDYLEMELLQRTNAFIDKHKGQYGAGLLTR